MSSPIRVVMADDHPTFRDGLRSVLGRADDIAVIGEAGTGEGAVELCAAQAPDVVLMDLQMPGIGGLEATRRLRAHHPGIAVLVLTMSDADESVYAALRLGALGYLLKDTPGPDIVEAVRRVAAGQALYGPAVAGRIAAFLNAGPGPHPFPELTTREREVLDLMARGLDNAAIARRLVVSPKTVRNNVSAVFAKLHVATRAEAVVRAREAGLGTE
ncbi:response regulator [Ornithinicoccus halotolerans]|uniref:response regulator n=1 Tax=Ornithinicoccus halotolerans TaxID=1748220 RepID=UPI001E2BDA9A|nr:response regulator transcription factor [Ornithinicoccus halotolerans]